MGAVIKTNHYDQQFWLNLPVKDEAKSMAFFTGVGFTLHEHKNDGKYRNQNPPSLIKASTQQTDADKPDC